MAEGYSTPTSSGTESISQSPRRAWRGEQNSQNKEFFNKQLQTTVDEIVQCNEKGDLWTYPKELVTQLHIFVPTSRNDFIQEVLISQYNIAKRRKNTYWIKEFRACVAIYQDQQWMRNNLDYRPPARRHPVEATSRALTQDIRLRTDSSLQVVREVLTNIKKEGPETAVSGVGIKPEIMGPVVVQEPIVISDEEQSDREVISRSSARPERMETESFEVREYRSRTPDNLPRTGGQKAKEKPRSQVQQRKGKASVTEYRRQKTKPSVKQTKGKATIQTADRGHKSRSVETQTRRQKSPSPDHRAIGRESGIDRGTESRSVLQQDDLRRRLERKRRDPCRDASPIQGPSKKKVHLKHCVISSCKSTFRNARRHAMERHLPIILHDEQLADQSLANKRTELLLFLKHRLTGEEGSYQDLIKWVNRQGAIPGDAFVPETDIAWLRQLCKHQKWQVPNTFKLVPVNSAALLCHWKVLLVMLNHLSEEERQQFRAGKISEQVECEEDYQVVDSVGFCETSTATVSSCLEAFDSHFHADRLSRVLFGNPREAVDDLIKADVGCTPRIQVNVVGGVMVYCDPEAFPVTLPSVKGFGSAVGVHPKKCHLLTDERFQQLLGFLKGFDVVALGEIGLDRTEPEASWGLQERTMVRLLQFSMPVRPVILHMRERSDQHAGEVSTKCLQIMKANAAPTQKIHLHSFGGTVEQVVGWLEAFPNCYFGFSERVSSFDKYQIAALQRIPDNRLLLETDAPYFRKATAKASTPAFIGDIGEVVSRHRSTPLPAVMELIIQNGRGLYSL